MLVVYAGCGAADYLEGNTAAVVSDAANAALAAGGPHPQIRPGIATETCAHSAARRHSGPNTSALPKKGPSLVRGVATC